MSDAASKNYVGDRFGARSRDSSSAGPRNRAIDHAIVNRYTNSCTHVADLRAIRGMSPGQVLNAPFGTCERSCSFGWGTPSLASPAALLVILRMLLRENPSEIRHRYARWAGTGMSAHEAGIILISGRTKGERPGEPFSRFFPLVYRRQ